LRRITRFFKKGFVAISHSKTAIVGLSIITVVLVFTIFSPVIAPYPIDEMNVGPKLLKPNSQFIMGTDMYGRDVFSRVIMGASVSLRIAFTVIALAMLIGVALGTVAGYTGGVTGSIIMRICDVMLCFPWVMVALCVAAITGPGEKVVIIALVFAYVPTFVRLMYGVVLSVREQEYVSAAIVIGEKKRSVILRYVLPNCVAPIIVEATLVMSFVILEEAAISYLGVGIQPPTPSWGAMLSEGAGYMWNATYLSIFPGLAIIFAVLGINLFGDGLRDILDPKYMGGLREV
jgi:ABC-type dipeptide/oligopeptide/nickel transport system permease subunit